MSDCADEASEADDDNDIHEDEQQKKEVDRHLVEEADHSPDPSRAGNFIEKSYNSRINFLIECMKLSHEEGMMRIKSRDGHLRNALVVQTALAAVSFGFEFGGIKASSTNFDLIWLAPIIAATFATLYFVENSLIANLSQYAASLSQTENRLSQGIMIRNWDASQEYNRDYMSSTLPFRTTVQFIVFVLFPTCLLSYRIYEGVGWTNLFIFLLSLELVAILYTSIIIVVGHLRRRQIVKKANPFVGV